uniref:Putative secreted protein n=1 Tax=Panstrongylus lignarius TaxID=156445 RepID=A0A224Y5A9_9HEMI
MSSLSLIISISFLFLLFDCSSFFFINIKSKSDNPENLSSSSFLGLSLSESSDICGSTSGFSVSSSSLFSTSSPFSSF